MKFTERRRLNKLVEELHREEALSFDEAIVVGEYVRFASERKATESSIMGGFIVMDTFFSFIPFFRKHLDRISKAYQLYIYNYDFRERIRNISDYVIPLKKGDFKTIQRTIS